MSRPARTAVPFLLALAIALAAPAHAQRVLFDARHGQTAGNADWIVDADSSQQVWLDFRCSSTSHHHSAQRFPTPPQSEITPSTDETFWNGGISAWAIALAKDALTPGRGRTWAIEQYPWDAPELTFGDPSNPQDLAGYDVLVLCEPNVLFSAAEEQAIREFVWNGGGLFLCADHETSDRNCSGGGAELHDSPFILNRLMQTGVETRTSPPYFDPGDAENDYGVFGIWFYENGNDEDGDPANRAFDWFDDATDHNVASDPDDPIVHGPFGDGSGGVGLFGSTQMAVSTDPERGNPTALGHVWRSGADREAGADGVYEEVTLASAQYGAGRVVAIGDSSPADDGTGQGSLHPGWDKAVGGVANAVLFLNATEWLANPTPDTSPPVVTGGPDGIEHAARSGAATLEHRLTVTGLAPSAEQAVTVEVVDACGTSADADLTLTTPEAPASIDLSGWRLVNSNRQFELTFPEGTTLAVGGYLVIGRANDRAGFEEEWGPLAEDVSYLSSGDSIVINATPRPYTLVDREGTVVDGPTVEVGKNASRARRNACADPGVAEAWNERDRSQGDPGAGAPPPCGAGVVITEISDAADYRNEFVELVFDP